MQARNNSNNNMNTNEDTQNRAMAVFYKGQYIATINIAEFTGAGRNRTRHLSENIANQLADPRNMAKALANSELKLVEQKKVADTASLEELFAETDIEPSTEDEAANGELEPSKQTDAA